MNGQQGEGRGVGPGRLSSLAHTPLPGPGPGLHPWAHLGGTVGVCPRQALGWGPSRLPWAQRPCRGSLSAPQGSVSAEGLGCAGRVGSPSLQRSGSPRARPGRWLARAKLIHNDLCLPLPGNG